MLSPDQDPRQALVDWMVDAKNPFFAPALANRYWKHFFGRGLVEPEDDMRATNPASNPELLAALAQHFIASKFDLKELVRTICNSQVYQLSAVPNKFNAGDRQSYSHYYPKRLTAEVLLDAVDQVTAAPTKFNGMPMGTRAVELPDSGFNSYFLTVFGRPEGSSACECERSNDANLAQSLHLLNSADVQQKVGAGSRPGGRVGRRQAAHAGAEDRSDLLGILFAAPGARGNGGVAGPYCEEPKTIAPPTKTFFGRWSTRRSFCSTINGQAKIQRFVELHDARGLQARRRNSLPTTSTINDSVREFIESSRLDPLAFAHRRFLKFVRTVGLLVSSNALFGMVAVQLAWHSPFRIPLPVT